MTLLSRSHNSQFTAPTHAYPKWLRRARAAFNPIFNKAVADLDCPMPLKGPVSLATDLGRRIRPSLYYAFWRAIDGKYPTCAEAMPAVAIEFFHAASIIIDDIADGEISRRDKRPLYRVFGIDVAVLTAHYLTAAGYRTLEMSEHPSALIPKWTNAYSDACVGQANDYLRDTALPISDQQQRSLQKTVAFFKFVGETIDLLQRDNRYGGLFAILGEAFQVGNDVVDLLEFEQSQRHSRNERYTLRLSYLVPMLIELGIIRESDLFKQLTYDSHLKISRDACIALPPAREILDHHSRLAKRQVSSFWLSSVQRAMATTFIDHSCMRSFWQHEHHE